MKICSGKIWKKKARALGINLHEMPPESSKQSTESIEEEEVKEEIKKEPEPKTVEELSPKAEDNASDFISL